MYDSYVFSQDSLNNLCKLAQKSGLTGFCFVRKFENTEKIRHAENVSFGTEIAFEYETHERIALELTRHCFDYVLNSVKTVDGTDLSERSYYSAHSRNDAYSKYLEKVFDSLDAAVQQGIFPDAGAQARREHRRIRPSSYRHCRYARA